jgi:hypothetical protein
MTTEITNLKKVYPAHLFYISKFLSWQSHGLRALRALILLVRIEEYLAVAENPRNPMHSLALAAFV